MKTKMKIATPPKWLKTELENALGPEAQRSAIEVIITRLVKKGTATERICQWLLPLCPKHYPEQELLSQITAAKLLLAKERSMMRTQRKASAAAKPRQIPQIDVARASANAEAEVEGRRLSPQYLQKLSPIPIPNDTPMAINLLKTCFAPNEYVNIVCDYSPYQGRDGRTRFAPIGRGVTAERDNMIARLQTTPSEFRSNAGAAIRINPVRCVERNAWESIRDEDIAAWKYVLVEFDALRLDLQLSLLVHLAMPIVAIVGSGHCSVHAWVRVDCENAEQYRKCAEVFMKHLARFGLSRENTAPSRMSRLPGVIRFNGGGLQELLYLNSNPTGRAIISTAR